MHDRLTPDLPEAIASRLEPVDRSLATLETPAVLVDVRIAERNLARWARRCASLGLVDRPHIKTHRTVAFALRQMAHGAKGITCQTVAEAEIMAEAGIDDILITTNTLGAAKLTRLGTLARRCRLSVVADSPTVAQAASDAAVTAGATIHVRVECETGSRRCGVVDPVDAARLAAALGAMPGLRFDGILTYPPPQGREASAEALATMVAACREAGIDVPSVSTGGTPQIWREEGLENVTEYRAGTYIYNDRSLVNRGAATLDDCALTVLATVVSHAAPDRAVLDAGSKALTSDLLGQVGHGLILGYPDAEIAGLSEEHGHVDLSRSAKKPVIGERVRVVPNHACVVANLFDRVFVVDGERLLGALTVDARGRSI